MSEYIENLLFLKELVKEPEGDQHQDNSILKIVWKKISLGFTESIKNAILDKRHQPSIIIFNFPQISNTLIKKWSIQTQANSNFYQKDIKQKILILSFQTPSGNHSPPNIF